MVPDTLFGVPEMLDTPPGRMSFLRLSFDNSPFRIVTKRLLPLTSEAVRLSEACFERGFGLACDVKTVTFDPQTTFCRPRIPRSPLKPFFCFFAKKRPRK